MGPNSDITPLEGRYNFQFFIQSWCGFFSLNLLNWELPVVCRRISFGFFYGFRDKLSFFKNFHLILMEFFFSKWSSLWVILLFYFEKESKSGPNAEILHNWKAYLTLEIVKQDKCSKYNWLFPAYYCVQQFTMSTKILCLHLLLIYTCSTFPCQHAAVVSCFALCNPLFVNNLSFIWTILSQWYLAQSNIF